MLPSPGSTHAHTHAHAGHMDPVLPRLAPPCPARASCLAPPLATAPQWVFCAASTTIMAGAVAERCTFFAYILFAAFYSGWVYPVFAHWTWSAYGWLSVENSDAILGIGAIDVAGSGVVHVQVRSRAHGRVGSVGDGTGNIDTSLARAVHQQGVVHLSVCGGQVWIKVSAS
eukprot:266954-Chlamydomonas_euryale.AAC.1